MTTSELIKSYVENKHYKVIDEDETRTVFRYQLSVIQAIADEKDEHFCSVIFLNFDEVTEENALDLVIRCNKLSASLKSVKAYVLKDNIVAAVEFYYQDENDFDYQMQQALDAVMAARAKYEDLKEEE